MFPYGIVPGQCPVLSRAAVGGEMGEGIAVWPWTATEDVVWFAGSEGDYCSHRLCFLLYSFLFVGSFNIDHAAVMSLYLASFPVFLLSGWNLALNDRKAADTVSGEALGDTSNTSYAVGDGLASFVLGDAGGGAWERS